MSVALFGGHGALRRVVGGTLGAVQALREPFGDIGYPLFLVAAVAVLNVGSFLVSRWVYRRREF